MAARAAARVVADPLVEERRPAVLGLPREHLPSSTFTRSIRSAMTAWHSGTVWGSCAIAASGNSALTEPVGLVCTAEVSQSNQKLARATSSQLLEAVVTAVARKQRSAWGTA